MHCVFKRSNSVCAAFRDYRFDGFVDWVIINLVYSFKLCTLLVFVWSVEPLIVCEPLIVKCAELNPDCWVSNCWMYSIEPLWPACSGWPLLDRLLSRCNQWVGASWWWSYTTRLSGWSHSTAVTMHAISTLLPTIRVSIIFYLNSV